MFRTHRVDGSAADPGTDSTARRQTMSRMKQAGKIVLLGAALMMLALPAMAAGGGQQKGTLTRTKAGTMYQSKQQFKNQGATQTNQRASKQQRKNGF